MSARLANVSASAIGAKNSTSSLLNDSSLPHRKPGSNSVRHLHQIAKAEISAPTNFRHIVSGLDDYGSTHTASSPTSATTNGNGASRHQLPLIQTNSKQLQAGSTGAGGKSSSLSSTSSSSSSMLHSPNSPNNNNNSNMSSGTNNNSENLAQAISNTLKANSALYAGKF